MLTTSCLSVFANPKVSWSFMACHARDTCLFVLVLDHWKKMLSCEAKLEDLCFDMNCLIMASPHVVHFEETCRKSK